MRDVVVSPDGKKRCRWCVLTPDFIQYHDAEWGYPVKDDYKLFEKLSLESFQSGLSWRTILAKRENFREAFRDFNFNEIAKFTQKDVDSLLHNAGIVRHKGKIEAVINNARKAQDIVDEVGSLATFVWQYESSVTNEMHSVSTSKESIALSKALKKKGWKFVGPTTVYAFMQAMGLVNDHTLDCFLYEKVKEERVKFIRP